MNDIVGFNNWATIRARDSQGRVRWEARAKNLLTTEGRNYLLGAGLTGQTASSNWFFGLIDNSGYSAVSVSDTLASHSGWTENTDYTSETRVTWSKNSPSSAQVTTATASSITMSAGVSIRGLFLASDNTKGGTSGTLLCVVPFSAVRAMGNGESWELEYTVELTG